MRHFTTPEFWAAYDRLPAPVRKTADRAYERLREDPRHPSLHFKQVGRFWSVRVGLHYRSLGVLSGEDILWFWIGSHADYDRLLGR